MFLTENGQSISDFCQKNSIADSNFRGSNIKSELNGKTIVRILTEFPDLSPDWLLTGVGPMLRADGAPGPEVSASFPRGHENDTAITDDARALVAADERARRLAAAYATGKAATRSDRSDATDALTPEEDAPRPRLNFEVGRPYYNVDFRLGFDILIADQTSVPQCLIDFSPYNDCDLWVNASGDSMAPTIQSGDIVALRRIRDIRYLINGEIYALVTASGLRTIKRVRDDGDVITLLADNPAVAPQPIPKADLADAYEVRGCFHRF